MNSLELCCAGGQPMEAASRAREPAMIQSQLRPSSGNAAAQSAQLPSYQTGFGSLPQHHIAPPRPPPGMPMAPPNFMAQRQGPVFNEPEHQAPSTACSMCSEGYPGCAGMGQWRGPGPQGYRPLSSHPQPAGRQGCAKLEIGPLDSSMDLLMLD